jgi:hypothetical protein
MGRASCAADMRDPNPCCNHDIRPSGRTFAAERRIKLQPGAISGRHLCSALATGFRTLPRLPHGSQGTRRMLCAYAPRRSSLAPVNIGCVDVRAIASVGHSRI